MNGFKVKWIASASSMCTMKAGNKYILWPHNRPWWRGLVCIHFLFPFVCSLTYVPRTSHNIRSIPEYRLSQKSPNSQLKHFRPQTFTILSALKCMQYFSSYDKFYKNQDRRLKIFHCIQRCRTYRLNSSSHFNHLIPLIESYPSIFSNGLFELLRQYYRTKINRFRVVTHLFHDRRGYSHGLLSNKRSNNNFPTI